MPQDKPKPKVKPNQNHQNQEPQNQGNQKTNIASNAGKVPLMFQAPIQERGKIQYAGDPAPAKRWVEQWIKGAPEVPQENLQADVPVWQRKAVKPSVKLPGFGRQVQVREFQAAWRLLTNSGQDKDVILPVIGAKGMPFFPGSSMKGAFWRACPVEKRLDYCGGEVVEDGIKRTQPGILRFHGGYPIDMNWAKIDRLVDVVHGQQRRQVEGNDKTSANVVLSLYQPQMKFGISSCRELSATDWQAVWGIWEQALAQGLGGRTSAGYGYFEEVGAEQSCLMELYLQGTGLTSKLLTGVGEFRPNLFKATLRGHTLRILGGLTTAENAKQLTQKIWGGIEGSAIVGQIGVCFEAEDLKLDRHRYQPTNRPIEMPTYRLNRGKLSLLRVRSVSAELEAFVRAIVRFSLLLGGFGKSWRRVDHQRFMPDYFKKNDKPMIGCHWELLPESETVYVTAANQDLSNISKFLVEELPNAAIAWMQSEGYAVEGYSDNWREAWHPRNVQVWGRVAKNDADSQAIAWFHGNYSSGQSIKRTALTGQMGQTGRIWHRMYPKYAVIKGERQRSKIKYVELLTVFPDEMESTQLFLDFLGTEESQFRLLWGGEL